MKYDFALDTESVNSLSIIINQLKENTSVLEFGPAYGRLTRYMKEKMKCDVYLVELDEQAGKEALKYGKDLVVGDIEKYEWAEKYKLMKFDHIIFADVLEHLRNPLQVLKTAKEFLKEDGSILVSVPNLAHNAVLIDLMNNKFNYCPIGLLDDTHIHFFTKDSLDNMILEAGLFVSKEMATQAAVGTIEINNSVNDVAGIKPYFWNNRKYGDIYQYVYEIVSKETERTSCITQQQKYYFQLYYDKNGDWSEKKKVINYINPYKEKQCFEVELPELSNIVRIDPLNNNCIIQILNVSGKKEDNKITTTLGGTNARFVYNDLYYFESDDPQIIYKFDENIKKVVIEYKIVNADMRENKLETEIYCIMLEDLNKMQEQFKELIMQKQVIENEKKKIEDEKKEVENEKKEVENENKKIEKEKKEIENEKNKLQQEYNYEKERADRLQQQRERLESRRIYKLYKFFKKK